MPMRPGQVCSYPGCTAPQAGGKHYMCKDHRSYVVGERDAHITGPRAEYRKWYMLAPWRHLRSVVLAEQPFCAAPGCISPATEVDHIEPHRGDRARFFDRSNLQGLCRPCHGKKSAGERLGR